VNSTNNEALRYINSAALYCFFSLGLSILLSTLFPNTLYLPSGSDTKFYTLIYHYVIVTLRFLDKIRSLIAVYI